MAVSTLHTLSLPVRVSRVVAALTGSSVLTTQPLLLSGLLPLPAPLPDLVFKYSSLFSSSSLSPSIDGTPSFYWISVLFQAFLYSERAPEDPCRCCSVTATPQHTVIQLHHRNCLMCPALV